MEITFKRDFGAYRGGQTFNLPSQVAEKLVQAGVGVAKVQQANVSESVEFGYTPQKSMSKKLVRK